MTTKGIARGRAGEGDKGAIEKTTSTNSQVNTTTRPVPPPETPAKTTDAPTRVDTIRVKPQEGETVDQATARELLDPSTRHALTMLPYIGCSLGNTFPMPNASEFSEAIKANAEQAQQADLSIASRTLTAQALALDTIFGELSRRAALNMNCHIEAAERYMRLALKAQANSRATIEALVKLHQPKEQIVKHVYVGEGGKAIVADSVHYRKGSETPDTGKPSNSTTHDPDPLLRILYEGAKESCCSATTTTEPFPAERKTI